MKSSLSKVLILSSFVFQLFSYYDFNLHAKIIYVDANKVISGSGISFADAIKYLQDALSIAETDDEIWITAKGIQTPDKGSDFQALDRTAFFNVKYGVNLYGGFMGHETSKNERNLQTNKTILSGDLLGNDTEVDDIELLLDDPNRSDNSFYILKGSKSNIDGFIFTGANSKGSDYDSRGFAIYNSSSGFEISNCVIKNNSGKYCAGIYIYKASPVIKNTDFTNNYLYSIGGHKGTPLIENCKFIKNGYAIRFEDCNFISKDPTVRQCVFDNNIRYGIYNHWSSPHVTNCVFKNSTGTGVLNHKSHSIIENCTFYNHANYAIRNEYTCLPVIKNSIFWNNSYDIMYHNRQIIGGTPTLIFNCIQFYEELIEIYSDSYLSGNFESDPMFKNDDLHLSTSSPCIDSGDPFSDFSNEPLLNGCRVNIGAYGNTPYAAESLSNQCKFDINGDDVLNLNDLILILQVLSNSISHNDISVSTDFLGTKKIGLPEAIYLLKKLSNINNSYPTSYFHIKNTKIFDANNNEFVIKGVNNLHIWWPERSFYALDQIANTKANTVRIVWNNSGKSDDLEIIIKKCISLKLIPMVENHDTTGDIQSLTKAAEYWTRKDVLSTLLKYQKYLILNIGNEPGDMLTTPEMFRDYYSQAIQIIRRAGIKSLLVLDGASDYAQNGKDILIYGKDLIKSDKNLIFSLHIYDTYFWADINLKLKQFIDIGIPIIIGEFGHNLTIKNSGYCNGFSGDISNKIDAKDVIETCNNLGIGFLAYSWSGNNEECCWLNLVSDHDWKTLTPWGELVINGPGGILHTSRLASIF